jgi:hypothetical protein
MSCINHNQFNFQTKDIPPAKKVKSKGAGLPPSSPKAKKMTATKKIVAPTPKEVSSTPKKVTLKPKKVSPTNSNASSGEDLIPQAQISADNQAPTRPKRNVFKPVTYRETQMFRDMGFSSDEDE